MNILIIDNSIAFTGAFKCALNEAAVLSDKHSFIFVLPKNSKVIFLAEEKGYTVYPLPLKEINKSVTAIVQYPFYLLKNFFALKKIIRKEHIDVVQINDFYNLLGACLKATGFRGKLFTYVRFLPSVMPAILKKFWINIAQRYSDKVIGVSDTVVQQLPPHPKNIRIYDAIQLTEKYPAKSYTEGNEILLLYLANYTRGKGQEHAIEAFKTAYTQNQNLRLEFAGGDMGLAKNISFKNELMQHVRNMALEDVIHFTGFTSNIEQKIKNAAIVLNFSEAESFSMTSLEACFYGTPLIATKCGGPEEIIKHQETGLLVEKKNIDAMAKAILELAHDEAKRKTMGMAAKQYVRAKFSVDNFKQQFAEILA